MIGVFSHSVSFFLPFLMVYFVTQGVNFGIVQFTKIFPGLLVLLVPYLRKHCIIQGHGHLPHFFKSFYLFVFRKRERE